MSENISSGNEDLKEVNSFREKNALSKAALRQKIPGYVQNFLLHFKSQMPDDFINMMKRNSAQIRSEKLFLGLQFYLRTKLEGRGGWDFYFADSVGLNNYSDMVELNSANLVFSERILSDYLEDMSVCHEKFRDIFVKEIALFFATRKWEGYNDLPNLADNLRLIIQKYVPGFGVFDTTGFFISQNDRYFLRDLSNVMISYHEAIEYEAPYINGRPLIYNCFCNTAYRVDLTETVEDAIEAESAHDSQPVASPAKVQPVILLGP